jgi:hypothetical protein
MNSLFQNNFWEKTEHLSGGRFLQFVDGELQAREAIQVETHLEACWQCRVKTQKIQDAIADIIEFDDQVLTPSLLPPQNWRNFDRKLNELVAASGKQSFTSRLFGSLGRYLPSSNFVALPRPLLHHVVRSAAVLLILVLIVTLIIRFNREPAVSASQFLANTIAAQTLQTSRTADPVIHQRLQVRRKDQPRESQVALELWDDHKNRRVRQFLTDGNESIPVTARKDSTQSSGANLVKEVAQVLRANHMDAARPLSAASYQSWHNTLQHKRDEITRTKLADGSEVVMLRTIPSAPVNSGQIAEATFVVRATDWLPTELRLNVAFEGGHRVYELIQTISEVVSLVQIDPAIFADQPVVTSSTNASQKEIPKKETQPTTSLAPNAQPLSPIPAATAELEIEALRLLNQSGADLGEQISVKRTSAGLLEITGIVETDKRKNEILNALSPIANNQSIHIQIQTVADAVAKQTANKPTPSPSTRVVEITSNTMAAEQELRRYFANKGNDTDEAIRQYAARMVSLSGRAMDHLWAMKRLLNQFSREEVGALTSEARNKLIGLIRSHARSYLQTNELLRNELRPVFFPSESVDAGTGRSAVTDINELTQLVNQLFELGSSNDRIIRSAFTSSTTGGVMTSFIKTPQFRQSLKSGGALAAHISRAQ